MEEAFNVSMFSALETTSKDLSYIKKLNFVLVQDANIDEAISFIDKTNDLAFDIETTGLSFIYDKLVGFSIGNGKDAFYFPIAHSLGDNITKVSTEFLLTLLLSKKLTYHNAKFDWKFIKYNYNIDLPVTDDTYIIMGLLDSDKIESKGSLGLKNLVKSIYKVDMLELNEDFGTTDFSVIPVSDAVFYAAADSYFTYKIKEDYTSEITKTKQRTVYEIEIGILKFIADLELNGCLIDLDYISKNTSKLESIVTSMKKEIEKFGEGRFDINSPTQLSDMLFNFLKIKNINNSSVDVRVLKRVKKDHKVIAKLIEYSELRKLFNSFFQKISTSIAEDGRIHSDFNQLGTRSGRFSSSGGVGRKGMSIKINLQQLPKSAKFDIRRAFIPKEGSYWLRSDLSQIEYRVMAALSGDKNLIDAFNSGVDFHEKTASDFLKIPLANITSKERNIGKTLNFGVLYGMTKYGLGMQLNIPADEAEELILKYFSSRKQLKKTISHVRERAFLDKFVSTHFGRVRQFRNFPDDPKLREKVLRSAFNTKIQGTAADIIKLCIRKVSLSAKIKELGIKAISTVHDELNFEVPLSVNPSEAAEIVRDAMILKFKKEPFSNIQLLSDVEIGLNYSDLVKFEPEDFVKFEGQQFDLVYSALRGNSSRTEEKPLQKSKFVVTKPSVILDFDVSKGRLDFIRDLLSKNKGLFTVFFKTKEGLFQVSDNSKINPTPLVIRELSNNNIKSVVHSDSIREVDVSKILESVEQ